MISIVIRNKNEAKALENILSIITKVYWNNYAEIIVVDNFSSDNSVEIAEKYNCKVTYIKDFSYGKATNLGIETAKSNYVLLLSSHAIPIGKSFLKNTVQALDSNDKIAGVRYINSIENYNRALKNNFIVNEPIKNGSSVL